MTSTQSNAALNRDHTADRCYNSHMTQRHTDTAMPEHFEIVGYEYLEHHPYGALGDYKWVVEQFR